MFTYEVNIRPVIPIRGAIARRLLVNATVDAELVRPLLPEGVAPAAVGGDGRALVGVCLLRVHDLRPVGMPAALGRSFEGLAHRVAVRRADGTAGVHIVRRETPDRLARAVGGRVFPGTHHPIDLHPGASDLRVEATGHDAPRLLVDAVDEAPAAGGRRSVLGDDAAASAFFAGADRATSPSRHPGRHEELRMRAAPFVVRSVTVREIVLDRLAWALGDLPTGALSFDSAFLVRDVAVRFDGGAAA